MKVKSSGLAALVAALAMCAMFMFIGCPNDGGGTTGAYNVKVSVNDTSKGTITATPIKAGEGESVSLTISPAAGNQLATLSVARDDKTGVDAVIVYTGFDTNPSFIMPAANVTVTGTFSGVGEGNGGTGTDQRFFVKYGDFSNGSVTSSATSQGVASGATVTLNITPATNYRLKPDTLKVTNIKTSATVTINGSGLSRTFTMPAADVRVEAEFELDPHRVVIDTGITNGTVTSVPTEVAANATITLTVTPDLGYKLKEGSLKVSGGTPVADVTLTAGTGGTYTFTMPAYGVTVTAEFEAIIYTITNSFSVSDDERYWTTVTNSSRTEIEEAIIGTLVQIHVHAADEEPPFYHVGRLQVKSGETEITVNHIPPYYQFVMPAGDVTITGAFEQVNGTEFAITSNVKGPGHVHVASAAPATAVVTFYLVPTFVAPDEEEISYLYRPKAGSIKVTHMDDHDNIVQEGFELELNEDKRYEYLFEMPNHPVTIYVEFENAADASVAITPPAAEVDENIVLTIDMDESDLTLDGKLVASVEKDDYDLYVWLIDGSVIEDADSEEFEYDLSDYNEFAGKHQLTVIVQNGDKFYSKSVIFEVKW